VAGDTNRDRRFGLDASLLVDVGLVALTLAVYGQAWDFGLTRLDDPAYVLSNVHVTSGLSLVNVGWAFHTFYETNWIPLTWISLMTDSTFSGGSPAGYHITNILLHAANVLLLFHFLSRATGDRGSSAFVAALFAVHPIHAESVAWVTERKDVLSMFFGLLSLLFYVRYVHQRKSTALLAALGALIASLLSKQTFVTLPFVFLLLDFWPLKRFGTERPASLIIEKLPFFLLTPVICAITFAAQTGRMSAEFYRAPISMRVANALVAYVSYIGKAILPFYLGVFYPFQTKIGFAQVAAALVLLVGITFVVVSSRRKFPFLLVGWLWYLGTLVPMIGVVKVGRQQMADRYAYLPFIGLYIAVAWTVATLVASRRLKLSLAAVTLAFYAAMGFVQVGYWQDGLTLMQHTCAVTRENWFCHSLLAFELSALGRDEEALEELRAGVRVDPQEPEIYIRLGDKFVRAGRLDEAAREYRSALEIRDESIDAHAGLGWTYLGQQKFAAAKREFARALETDPGVANVHFYMAYVCRLMGDYEESNRYCESGLEQNRDMTVCRRLMADNLDSLGRTAEADEIRNALPARSQPADALDQSWKLPVPRGVP
jgi:Flp pilus assembly protein TadD